MKSRSHGPDGDPQDLRHLGTVEAGVVREHDNGTLFEGQSIECAIERITVEQPRDLVRSSWGFDRVDSDIETCLPRASL